MNLGEIFDSISDAMLFDMMVAEKAIENHKYHEGAAHEETVYRFLRKYLPKSLGITTGFLVDIYGKQSKQLDIIVFDEAKTPIFFESNHTRIIPVECVFAVIEVKKTLNTAELRRCYENMKSIRSLKKKAFYTKEDGAPDLPPHLLYGKKWNYWPIHYFVFAFQSSISITTLRRYMERKNAIQSLPLWKRIDCICILSKGIICNQYPDKSIEALPDLNTKLKSIKTKRSLLMFYTLISGCLNQAQLRNFKLSMYTEKIPYKS